MPTPGSTSSDPTATAAEELRWRLGALVSRFGERLASDPEAWRACELELSSFYSGPYAVRTYAIVQALKGGLVADLVTWHREGARGVDGEIAQRLVERSGASRPIAEWAIAQWSFAFRLDDATPAAPVAAAAAAAVDGPTRAPAIHATPRQAAMQPAAVSPRAAGRELVVRVPHLVGAGIVIAAALIAAMGSGIGPPVRIERLLGEPTVSAPELPPAPSIEGPPRPAREMTSAGDLVAPPAPRREPERHERERPATPSCASNGEGAPMVRARLVRDYAPPFPRDLADAGTERGEAVLRFEVNREGRVRDGSVEIVDASHPLFAQSAREVADLWRYEPARRDGCAVTTTVMRTVRFRLR